MLAYLGLLVAVALTIYGVLSYTNSAALAGLPVALRRPGDILWFVGLDLLALAALLGWVGLTFDLELRLVRILLAIGGVVLLALAWPRGARTA